LLPVVGFASRIRPEGASLWQRVGLDPSVAGRRSEGLRQLFDLSTMTLVRNIRMSADPSFVPEEVHYFTEAHANTREHQRFFGGTLRFGQPVTQVIFSARVLDLPMRFAASTAPPSLAPEAQRMAPAAKATRRLP
jgi:hypothetical protein